MGRGSMSYQEDTPYYHFYFTIADVYFQSLCVVLHCLSLSGGQGLLLYFLYSPNW